MKKKLLVSLACLLASFTIYSQDIDISVFNIDKIDISKTVNTDDAGAWVKRYKKKKWKRHNRRFPIVGTIYDARTCWFNLDSIVNFVKYLDSMRNAPKKVKFDGVRFYYIAYRPQDSSYHHQKKYRNAHSLLWVATMENKTGKSPVFHEDVLINDEKRAVALTVMNTGTLCPPLSPESCNGTTLLDLADKKR